MIYLKKNKGISLIEVLIAIAIISTVLLGGGRAIQYIMKSVFYNRVNIQADNFSRLIINELKARCVPESFLTLDTLTTPDWEGTLPERKFPDLRAAVNIGSLNTNGQRKVNIAITCLKVPFAKSTSSGKTYKTLPYSITLVVNTGLIPAGIISGKVVNYVTMKGIPDAEVAATSAKVDGVDVMCTTRADGSFTLTNVKVGPSITVKISKLGSHPNDLNYNPGYYFDPDIIDPTTKEPIPGKYENTNYSNDTLYWNNTCDVQNNMVTNIGTAYLCPMAVVRGWVREKENDPNSGIGKFVVWLGQTGNFNTSVLLESYRNTLYKYYTYGQIMGGTSSTNALNYLDDASFRQYSATDQRDSNYYCTTSDCHQEFTYQVEGTPITVVLEKGDFIFFNIRPDNGTYDYYHRQIKFCGRPGTCPTLKRSDPQFEWGYIRSYTEINSYYNPRIQVRTNNCFDTTGSSGGFIKPLINEAKNHHDPLPVTNPNYKFFKFGTCTNPNRHYFNSIARANNTTIQNIDYYNSYMLAPGSSCGCPAPVDYTQNGWNNWESIQRYYPGDLPTCYVARRRGGIKGRVIDMVTNQPIAGITVRSKVWADTTGWYYSWPFTKTFRDSCPQTTTDSNGEFELNNIFGMQQQFVVTFNPTSELLPGWRPHITEFQTACTNDLSIQNYAALRITDNRTTKEYMPRLIRPFSSGKYDHQEPSYYPLPTWCVNMGAAQEGITDFGDIAMLNKNLGVTVTGRLVDDNGNGIPNLPISTLGIFGLSGDDNNELFMDGWDLVWTGGTTDADGYYSMPYVQPNFVHLLPGTTDIDHIHYDSNQPKGSIRSMGTFKPSGIEWLNLDLTCTVLDIYSNAPIDQASVFLSKMKPTTFLPDPDFIINLGNTNFEGKLHFNSSIINPYLDDHDLYEHIPAHKDDPYLTLNPDIQWDDTTRTLTLHPFTLGKGNDALYCIFGAEKNLPSPTDVGSYKPAYTYDTAGNENNGEYWMDDGVVTSTPTIKLERKYRVKLYGRAVDQDGQGIKNCYLLAQRWSPEYLYQYYYSTNDEGYWGDWTPAGIPGTGAEFNFPMASTTRTAIPPGAPYWYIRVYAYAPFILDGGSNYRYINFTTPPAGWSDGDPVQIPDITLPRYYSTGQ